MASTFRIIVQIDPKGARQGARVVKNELNQVSNAATRTRQLIARAFAFATIGAGITASVRILANFSQEMSTVRAVTGATETQFQSLREEAKRLGSETRFSATQAAEGMTFLARAGFETEEVLSSIGDVLNLAQAGALDLGRAADITSNVLQGFGLAAGEAGRVVDVLALTANSANTDVEQLGQAMSFLAPAAKAVGVPLELAAAAVAALSDAGIQATRAGTGLRQIFIQLEKAGGELSVKNNGLVKVLETLRKRNLSLAAATDLVGARQAAGLLVILDSIDKIKLLNAALANAEGAAARAAAIMDANLNGALLAVKSAIEGFIIAIGDSGATGALEGFFRALASGIRTVTKNIDTFLAILNTLVIVIGINLARTAIPAAIVAIRALGVAILANPIGLIATIIATAIAALISFRGQLVEGRGAFRELGDAVTAFLGVVGGLAGPIINAIVSIFPSLKTFELSWDIIAKALTAAIGIMINGLDFFVAVFVGAKATIIATLENIPAAFVKIFTEALNGAIAIVETGVGKIINLINLLPKVDIDFKGFGRIDDAPTFTKPVDTGIAAFNQQRGQISGQFETLQKELVVKRDLAAADANLIRTSALVNEENKKLIESGNGVTTSTGGSGKAANELANAYASLAASVSPLVAAQQQLSEVQKILTDAVAAGLTTQEQAAETLRRVRREIVGVGNAQTDFTEKTKLLNDALRDGIITAGEYGTAVTQLEKDVNASSTTIGSALEGTFQKAGDALAEFVKTGKIDFKSLISSMIQDLFKLASQSFGKSGSSSGGLFSGLGSLFGGNSSGSSSGGFFSGLGSLFGFANGGGFTVGGNFGRDRNILSINDQPVARVSRGEAVDVSPNGGGRAINVVMNINTPDADSFDRSQGQILARTQAALSRSSERNN